MTDNESVRQWAIDDITAALKAAGVRRPRKTAVLAVNAFADWLVGFDDLRDALNEGRTRGQRPDLLIVDETHGFMTTEGISSPITQPFLSGGPVFGPFTVMGQPGEHWRPLTFNTPEDTP